MKKLLSTGLLAAALAAICLVTGSQITAQSAEQEGSAKKEGSAEKQGSAKTDDGMQIAGKVKSCIDCHASAKGDDYLFTNDE